MFSMGSCPAQPIFSLNRVHEPTKLIRKCSKSLIPSLRQTEIYRNMKKMNSTAVTIYLKKDNRFLLLYNIRETKMLLSVTR